MKLIDYDYAELSKKINTFRLENSGKEFTKKELLEILSQLNMPFKSYLFTGFIKSKNLILVKKGKKVTYHFSVNPIHQDTIKGIILNARDYQKETNLRYYTKRNNREVNMLTIEEAIQLLKNNGYKVYKPTVAYEEI